MSQHPTHRSKALAFVLVGALLCALIMAVAPTAFAATTIYVAETGNDATGDGSAGNPYFTIQKGITMATDGDTVSVGAGTYGESPNLTKPVQLLGAGSATTVINGTVTVDGAASGVAGTPTLVKGFDINSGTPVNLGHTLQYARIEDCKIGGAGNGIRVGAQANVAHLEFVGLTFYGNVIDVYFANESLEGASTADDILFDNCVFSGTGKGIYAEKLSNAVIKNSTFTDVANVNQGYYGQAIDINLKWADYTNITIQDNTFTNSGNSDGTNGVGGSAIGIKARGTGGDTSYATRPATLTNVTVTGNTITGGQRGVRMGEPGKNNTGPTNVQIHSNKFIGIPTTLTGTDIAGAVANTTTALTNAKNNWWGSACGPLASGASPVSVNVDYTPWWTDAAGTGTAEGDGSGGLVIPAGASTAAQNAVMACAAGKTVTYAGSPAAGGVVVNTDRVTIDLGGFEIGPGSSAFTINADNVVVQNGTLNGGTPKSTFPAVLVNASADNFTLSKVEVKNWLDGVQVAGPVTSFKMVNNFVWGNGNGLKVDGVVSGVATVEGNLFKANSSDAIVSVAQPAQLLTKLPAQWNSFADKTCPTYANVDTANCTFAETYVDVDPDTLAAVRNVNESQSFDVKVVVDAQNLYGYAFKLSYDATKLTKGTVALTPPGGYSCFALASLAPNEIGYQCQVVGVASAFNGGPVLTINFTATPPAGDGPWDALIDVDHVASTAGTANGALVYLNNVKLAGVPNARDITDADDGKITITGIANFRGFIDVQGRSNDSDALLEVYAANTLAAPVLANATSASGGGYTTMHTSGNLLTVGTTYYFVVDKALYVKTSATAVPNHVLTTRAYTDLITLVLKGGDADNDEKVDVSDATCIGGAYGTVGGVCGTASGHSDVNSDGKVDILDLTLMGGNFGITASSWTP